MSEENINVADTLSDSEKRMFAAARGEAVKAGAEAGAEAARKVVRNTVIGAVVTTAAIYAGKFAWDYFTAEKSDGEVTTE